MNSKTSLAASALKYKKEPKEPKELKESAKGSKLSEMHIKKAKSGGYIVRHPETGEEHAVPTKEDLHDHLERMEDEHENGSEPDSEPDGAEGATSGWNRSYSPERSAL